MGGGKGKNGCKDVNILPWSQISVAVRMVPSSISGAHCREDKYSFKGTELYKALASQL